MNNLTDLGCLAQLPRTILFSSQTPIEPMANLSQQFPDQHLYVKRDDCNGLAFGGNKVRQLEYYFGEAQAQSADTVLITGAVQSNFVRLAAAAANKLGLQCHIQLEQRVVKQDPTYHDSGNVLLDKLLGATLHSYLDGEDEEGADKRLGEIAGELKQQGNKPYIIPLAPGHKPLGALGYINAAQEILEQEKSLGFSFDEIIVASGSGNTHAGLLFGLRALGSRVSVIGVCVRRNAKLQHPRIKKRCDDIADLLDMQSPVTVEDVQVMDEVFEPGYGQLNSAVIEAMKLAAKYEALILDPVYTGKSMAGLLARVRAAEHGKRFLFIHTGGTPGLFAYETEMSEVLG